MGGNRLRQAGSTNVNAGRQTLWDGVCNRNFRVGVAAGPDAARSINFVKRKDTAPGAGGGEAAAGVIGAGAGRPLVDISVLLVEDNALIGLDAEDMLRAMGAREVCVAHTLPAARAALARGSVQVVVLDLLIGSERSEGLARELVEQDLPVVIASGLANTIQLPDDIRHLPVVAKPYSPVALETAFRTLGIVSSS